MAAVNGTFTSTGNSAAYTPLEEDGQPLPFRLRLSGTFSATVALQSSTDQGATWQAETQDDGTAYTWTGAVNVPVYPVGSGMLYRLSCTAYTSGTVTYRLGYGAES